MHLYLIRHAESENNARPESMRQEDPPISSIGQRQAKSLARWASGLSFDELVTSPFLRTLQTTRAMLDVAPRSVQVWHNVFEKGGCFRGHGPDAVEGGPGLGRSEIVRQLGGDLGADPSQANENQDQVPPSEERPRHQIDGSIGEEGWWAGRQRETEQETVRRCEEVAERIVTTFGDRDLTVVAVIHADLKRLLLSHWLSPAIDIDRLGPLRNTGITKLLYRDGRWSLDWFNSLSHLSPDLVGEGEGYAASDASGDA